VGCFLGGGRPVVRCLFLVFTVMLISGCWGVGDFGLCAFGLALWWWLVIVACWCSGLCSAGVRSWWCGDCFMVMCGWARCSCVGLAFGVRDVFCGGVLCLVSPVWGPGGHVKLFVWWGIHVFWRCLGCCAFHGFRVSCGGAYFLFFGTDCSVAVGCGLGVVFSGCVWLCLKVVF